MRGGWGVTCHNCNRRGHVIRDCYAHFCSIHNTTGHPYSQCYGRNNRYTSQSERNRSPSMNRGWHNNSQGGGNSYTRNVNYNANGRNVNNGRSQHHSNSSNKNEGQGRGRSQTPSPNTNTPKNPNFGGMKRETKNT